MRRIASVYLRLVLAALICGVVLMAESGLVAADPIDRDGLGAQSLALSGLTTLNDSPLVAAQLPSAAWDTAGTWALALRSGFSHGHLRLGARPAGVDVSPSVLGAEVLAPWIRGWRPLPTDRLSARSAQQTPSIGTTLAFGGTWALTDRVRVTMSGSLPVSRLQGQASYFIDEREQVFSNRLRWTWLDESQQRLDMQAALLVRLPGRLVVAAGLWLGQRVRSQAEVYITSLSGEEVSPTNVETEVLSSASPSLSLSWRPTESLTLQAGWQGSRTTGIETVSRVKIRGLDGDPNSQREDVSRLSLGQVAPRLDLEVAWRRGDSGIAAGVTIHQSSTLQTMHSEAISGGLHDSLTARLGGRLALTDGWRLMGAVSYRSSAVPEQTGRQNLVDNDLAAASFGASWSHRSAWGNLRVSAGWKSAYALPRTHTKRADAADPVFDEFPDAVDPKTTDPIAESQGFQTNNPGFPSYSSEAWIHSFCVSVAVHR